MLRGREVRERMQRSTNDKRTITELLAMLAEDNAALHQENVMLAQLVDQNASLLLNMTNVVGVQVNAVNALQKMRGHDAAVGSEEV